MYLHFQKKKFNAYSSDDDDEENDKDESLLTDDGSNYADSDDCK